MFFKVEWKKAFSQNLVAFLSVPWLSAETNGLDLELFKEKTFKQCSTNLLAATTTTTTSSGNQLLKQIKIECIQLLCMLPKNVCPQWRSQVMSRCVRNEPDADVRRCALTYLPYLIYSLGVSANSLVFQLVHPAMGDEKSPDVLRAYAAMLTVLCCLISRKSLLIRKSVFAVCASGDEDTNNDRYRSLLNVFNF